MRLACDKAAACGVGVVAVRNSNHFGAAGAYAMMAPERGLIGFVTSATWRPGIVPTLKGHVFDRGKTLGHMFPAGFHFRFG